MKMHQILVCLVGCNILIPFTPLVTRGYNWSENSLITFQLGEMLPMSPGGQYLSLIVGGLFNPSGGCVPALT